MEPSRNAPCPCGSGKKFKRCCGASPPPVPVRSGSKIDYLALNRAIAYKGKIGKIREDFCRQYIARKQTSLKEIEKDQADKVAAMGETITCRKGCSTCCTQYIQGTLQECEAIVYYLYQHESVLAEFLRAYPVWRAKVRQNESVFRNMKDVIARNCIEGFTAKNDRDYQDANTRFLLLNIPCPFLSKGACSIHEVRPWTCAKPVATTPSEWCHPSTNVKNDAPNVYVSRLTPVEMPLYRDTGALNLLLVHLGVYEILEGGYMWLSDIPGLQGLDKEALNDPEVKAILPRYL